ncbi:hypothetical protein GCM10025858_25970 [Alicyclobacillus sacchari]|nr:GNAT family N-acetyltransferase [Alicyclobacillus sacchari]GMA58094.1 hypothetical protein GCM10025858_25970 [Alicyclobacillus sacchari]
MGVLSIDVTVIKPTIEHASAISIICATGWKQTVQGLCSEEYQTLNVQNWYHPERVCNDILTGSYTHVALVDSVVVGTIGGGMTGSQTGEVFVLYVDEKYRYKGIGRLLLEALTQQQLNSGAIEQYVSVQEGNYLGIPFYEARGFICKGKRSKVTETGETLVSLRYWREIVSSSVKDHVNND